MASHQHEPLRPRTIAEPAALTRIVKASSERAERARRASALVALAAGASCAQAARQAGCRSERSVAKLVGGCQRRGRAALDIAGGRGRRPTDAAAARGRIVATAQRAPERRTAGTATWSLGTLRRRWRRDGLPRVGTGTLRRVRRDAGSSYRRTRTGGPSGTARRVRKRGGVTGTDPETEQTRG